MPTECIQGGFRCGTTSPLWMNGSYPSVGELSNVPVQVITTEDVVSAHMIFRLRTVETTMFIILGTQKDAMRLTALEQKQNVQKGRLQIMMDLPQGVNVIDPCQSVNYKVLRKEVKRSANYSLNEGDTAIEDSRLRTGWYRVDSVIGNDIVNQSVSMMQCGTLYRLWMQGNIPDVGDKTVDRKVSTSGLSSMCEAEYDIKVRNCGSFRTYFLQQLNVDKSGYCFGTLPVPAPPSTMKPPLSTVKEDGGRSYTSIMVVVGILAVFSVLLLIIIVLIRYTRKKPHQIDL
ncbi:unnamed protein product [Mytilus coruscus]|uniref:Uncharacterized protein n=1 Tax=Mytilus coruscus TaxID=42192 RepID=A0A6J8C678_MYTCO|nr:unnamed protein product [Mytilus coruscus]